LLGYCIVGEKEREEQQKEKDSVSCVDFKRRSGIKNVRLSLIFVGQ
jgi:hypothetical protein